MELFQGGEMTAKVNKTADDLTSDLVELQAIAEAQNKEYQSSREKLHGTLANAFAWWLDARNMSGDYYKKKCMEHGVDWKPSYSNNDEKQFIPLIKLTWKFSQKIAQHKKSTISRWNNALRAIYREYVNRPEDFEVDAGAKALSLIYDNGGLSKLQSGIEDFEEDGHQEKVKPLTITQRLEKLKEKTITDGKVHVLKAKPICQSVKLAAPVIATRDNLVALVGRVNASGEIEIVSTSDDEEIIKNLSASTATADIGNAPPTIAALTEVVKTQLLPQKLLNRKSDLAELAKLLDSNGKASGQKVHAVKRLTICAKTGLILYSLAKKQVSVVTQFKPHAPFMTDDENVYLNRHSLRIIEEAFAYKKFVNYVTASPKTGLGGKKAGFDSKYHIDVDFGEADYKRTLYFAVPKQGPNAFQANIDSPSFDWEYELTPSWAALFNAKFSNWWVNESSFGSQITRKDGSIIKLEFSKQRIEAFYQKRDVLDGESEEYIHKRMEALPDGCKVEGIKRKTALEFNSKDIIPVLCSLPSMQFNSDKIKLSGNKQLICFSFSTQFGDYKIYIPAINEKRERFADNFAKFEY